MSRIKIYITFICYEHRARITCGSQLNAGYTTKHQGCVYSPVHTTPEEFENRGFTLKTHQMFSVHTTPEEVKNATIPGQFRFVFEENSARKIT